MKGDYQLIASENAASGSWSGAVWFKGKKVGEVTGPNRDLIIANAQQVKAQHVNKPPEEIIDL